MRHLPSHLSPILAALPALWLLVGCASQSPDPPTAAPTGVTSGALGATSGATPALDLLRRGGSFLFALDESDPARRFHEQCAKEGGGDAAKAEACYAHIREVGSHEGMRFSVDGERRVLWTSFGLEDGKEAIYLEGPLAVTADGERGVVATFAAPPHGLQMEGKAAWPRRPVRFEFPDERTMVMTDEVKGRLVFHRAAP